MIEYGTAWMVVAGAGLLALLFWLLITRGIRSVFWRTLLRGLAAVWMLLPAPVPDYPGQFAPAYIVALFESVFQTDGKPNMAVAILLAGSVAVLVLAIIRHLLRGRRRVATESTRAQRATPKPQ